MNNLSFSLSNQPENPPLPWLFSSSIPPDLYFQSLLGILWTSITPLSKRNISHGFFPLFWERSRCLPALTPSGVSQISSASLTSLRSEAGVQQQNGRLTGLLLSWASKTKSALRFVFGIPGEGLCALKVSKKKDVCSDGTTLFGDEDLPPVLLSFLCKWCFLNVQISWNWN